MHRLEAFCIPLSLGIYLAGAMLGFAFSKRARLGRWLSFGGSSLGASLGLVGYVRFLLGASSPALLRFELWRPILFPVHLTLRIDPLGAFFGMVLSFITLALSIYSLADEPEHPGGSHTVTPTKSPGLLGAGYNCLVLATALVFCAGDAVFFLLAWELMALGAFVLVVFEHEQGPEVRRAGTLYFIMSHLGTGCLVVAFLLLAGAAGDFSFDRWRGIGERLPEAQRQLVFLLFLAGFGVKAGMVPLHIWLPAAHPVAPSNVSALLSGVLIKAGIYGLARVLLEFLGLPPVWWGALILGIGAVSAVLGVLYALMEHDLKRLLAYHSIENIGIILMGLGAAIMFLRTRHAFLAGMALTAALYHTLNHATFKALLFLGAGAVLHSTGHRNMEALGGLIKRMPTTAFFFLIASVAISALPPLNGFVSEWLTFQALLQGFNTTDRLVRLLFPFGGAMLALSGALAAACFVKAFGITFLAQPRTAAAAQAREPGLAGLAGMGLLAGGCLFLGLFPAVLLRLSGLVVRPFAGQSVESALLVSHGLILTAGHGSGSISPVGLVAAAAGLAGIPLAVWAAAGRRTRVRRGPTWDCGLRELTPQMEYTATGFSKPLRMIFKALFRPRREVQRDYDYSPYFAKTIRFETRIEEAFEQRLYRPLNRLILRSSRRTQWLQAGSIRLYLAYIFLTLLGLLLFAL